LLEICLLTAYINRIVSSKTVSYQAVAQQRGKEELEIHEEY